MSYMMHGNTAKMKLKWKQGDRIEFQLRGWLEEGTQDTWHVDCHFKLNDGRWKFMAEFKRSGRPVLERYGFYSAIEDGDWSAYAKGHLHQRRARFRSSVNGESIESFDFTKGRGYLETLVQQQNKAWIDTEKDKDGFIGMSTGGDILMPTFVDQHVRWPCPWKDGC